LDVFPEPLHSEDETAEQELVTHEVALDEPLDPPPNPPPPPPSRK
jgi:hypothetical protein